MMHEGKNIHYSHVDNKPLCSYSVKLCKQRRLSGYAFCIRHILEDKSAPFKQCSHVARYNKQYCTNPIPTTERREYCNSHMQALGMAPKKEKKVKKEKKSAVSSPNESKVKFADRLKALIRTGYENSTAADSSVNTNSVNDDPYAFNETPILSSPILNGPKSINIASSNSNLTEAVASDVITPNDVIQHRSDSNSPINGIKPVSSPQDNSKSCNVNRNQPCNKRSSKTMNMLQEKIAQNRLLDKLKKTQESSQIISTSLTNVTPPANFLHSNNFATVGVQSNSWSQRENEEVRSNPTNLTTVPYVTTTSMMCSSKNSQSSSGGSQPYYSVFHPHMMLGALNTRLPPPPYSQALQYQASQQAFSTQSSLYSSRTFCKVEKVHVKNEPSAKIRIRPKRPKDKSIVKCSTSQIVPVSSHTAQVSTAISQLTSIYNNRKLRRKNLFPLGLEFSSDSERSDSENEDNCSCQSHWFQVFDNISSSSAARYEDQQARRKVRPARLALLKSEMRRQLRQLSKSQDLSSEHSRNTSTTSYRNLLMNLIKTAKLSPKQTVEFLVKRKTTSYYEQMTLQKPKKSRMSTGLIKRVCCYKNDSSSCQRPALPFSRHCARHITYNVDQQLFEHCTAKFADNTQCCIPVFDVCHELPLCPEHARKRDNYNKIASEPKNKKTKRKQKPSALTRNTKRSKKKKRAQPGRGNKSVPSLQTHEDHDSLVATSGSLSDIGTHSAISVSVDGDSQLISNGFGSSQEIKSEDITDDLGAHLDSEFDNELVDGQLSPEVMDNSLELPLDTAELANQASRLLEEHDFTEVLNKIPDDAFNDLFNESRNGEFMPSKEETEELERALAAVSKDVNSVKESLEKLSTAQIEEALGLTDGELLGNHDPLANVMDVQSLSNLTSSHGGGGLDMLNGQFSQSDLTSISQALSSISESGCGVQNNIASQSLMSMPNGLTSNVLLNSEVQQLQTQYLQQSPVSTSVTHYSANGNQNMQLPPPSYPLNNMNIQQQAHGRDGSNQWLLQQHGIYQQQNGYVCNNGPMESMDSTSTVKYPGKVESMKQTIMTSADPFVRNVCNPSIETVKQQQSTPAS